MSQRPMFYNEERLYHHYSEEKKLLSKITER